MDKEKKTFDFSGWATRSDVKCSDGRIIRDDAFKHNDGQTVPLVWNHNHSAPDNVLGQALLQNRKGGVYAYCSFNDTEQGQTAKELVKHGDICSLSIYANQLKQNGAEVVHGTIREVSLVLAGANQGAKIENVMVHGELDSEAAEIFNSSEEINIDVELTLEHAESEPKKESDKKNEEDQNKEETVEDIMNSLTEKQQTVVYAIIGSILKEQEEKNQEEQQEMKQNAFEQEINTIDEPVLSHSDIQNIFKDAKNNGSLKEAVNAMLTEKSAELKHSITNIDVLFPDYKAVKGPSTKDDSNQTWANKVMSKVHHSAFSRIKSSYFDVTGDDARARGYIKGNRKVEEVIAAFKRTTSPQTVYKLQKLDRDDIIDITDFDVVAYIKSEMRTKLDRELARAFLIGDGRSSASNDKINPLNIRPILGDDPVYTVSKIMKKQSGEDEYKFAKRFIKQAIKARKDYKGSGNPDLYCTEDLLTDMLLIEDKNERVIYDTIDKLKTALMVRDIITVPEFETQSRTADGKTFKLMGIFVNLNDYSVGADKGGAVNMFDDFDINYNKYEYLIETRCSGALVEPYSAISFEEEIVEETSSTNEDTNA